MNVCSFFLVCVQCLRDDFSDGSYLVDPASSHMLVSKIKPCMSQIQFLQRRSANGSLEQTSSKR